MECTPIEEKEATLRVLEWAGAECLYQVRVCRLEAWTAALIQDADTPNWGWEVAVRAAKWLPKSPFFGMCDPSGWC